MLQEEEVATSNFLPTKKELQRSSESFARKIIDDGQHNVEQVYAQALRLKEAITTIEKVFKQSLPDENFESFGLKGTYRAGGDVLNYSDDETWASLHKSLKDRENLLKTALNSASEIYDESGVLVPKVSSTPRKSSLAISF
jgi:hypothetical protein